MKGRVADYAAALQWPVDEVWRTATEDLDRVHEARLRRSGRAYSRRLRVEEAEQVARDKARLKELGIIR